MNRAHLMNIFRAGLAAVDPYDCVLNRLRLDMEKLLAAGSVYDMKSIGRIIVVGAGKASLRMAAGIEELLGDRIDEGAVIAPYGQEGRLRTIEQKEASHPLPDKAGAEATQRVLDLVRKSDEKTLVICLLSGGGSSLLVAPARGISLEDKQRTTDLLLKSGASIAELNCIRKHLSVVKGGRLAEAAYPASVLTLILSDVVGDRVDVIASGPTVPDDSTFADAVGIVHKYKLKHELPDPVAAMLERGSEGREQETAKQGNGCFTRNRTVVIGGIEQALFAARNKAKMLGYASVLVSSQVRGPARDAGRIQAQTALNIAKELKPGERRCLLFGGETTVAVTGPGKGGRNQELALAFAREISGFDGISMLSAGTDGQDGPTDAAGASVDGKTIQIARQGGISPEVYLGNNDSYTFFNKIDLVSDRKHLIVTGPTGTNVMDMQIILLEG